MAGALLVGAAVGLSVAAPFGPVSLLCVQRSLDHGYRHGVISGFGAATAHGLFATAAIASAGAASTVLLPWTSSIRLLSAVILIALGLRTIIRARAIARASSPKSLFASYGSLLILALSNPLTVLPYLTLATMAGGDEGSIELSLWSVPGVILAASTWYAGLCTATTALRSGVTEGSARILNLAAGSCLVAFGAVVGYHLIAGAITNTAH